MEISWLGHSCLRIRSNEATLITDPYERSLGLSMGKQRADIVTTSHSHPHHSHVESIGGNPKVLRGPGEYEIAEFYITGIGTRRAEESEPPEINTVFLIQAEGLTLCHLGDLSTTLSPSQTDGLGQADILFVPAGGVCTLSTDRVAQLVNLLAPKIVVPIHYPTEGVTVELRPLEAFLEDMGVSEPVRQSKITANPTNLPRDLSLVVLDRVT